MQVKQRLKINLILSTTTVLIVFLILALALYRINKANNIAKIAQDIILNAFERVTLRNDYLQNNNERAKAQWFARHEAIGRVLESESKSFQPAEDKKTIDELFKNHESIEKIFSAIVENREKKKTASDDTDISQEVEDRLLNQLNIKVYEEVLHGRELLASSREARSSATRLAGTWIACVLVILIAAVIINSGFMDRTITDRVRVLRDGALMIGGGNLDHRIDVKGDDEFAELSGAFNAMTINLQTSYLELKKEIAERKRVEEAFRESEERLRLAVEAADLGTFDLDITSGIAVHSPRHDQIFGYREPVPEWTYEIAIKHVLPEDLPLVLEAHASAEKTGVFGYEGRVVWSDGSIHWIAPRGTVHYDSDGRPVRLIGVIADITDLKRAEEVLRKAYDDLEIRVQERTKELNELNETLEQRVTERTAELQTANASLFNSRRAALNLMEDALAARRRAEEASDELRREVIERRRAEEALRQSREDLDRAQEVGQIGWWRLDTQQNVLTWSDENHRIFGLPLGTPLRYETFLGCIHPEDREYVDERWRAALGGEPYDIEHRVVADGRVKWVREKAYLEFDDAGTPRGGFGITQDITDRKRAEDALRDSEARLKIAQLSAGAGVWEWDIRGGTLTWSDELFGLFGLDPSKGQATFDAWRGTVHPDDREPAERRIEAAVAEHAPLASEYRVVLPTGEVRWIAALGNTTYAGDGTPIRMSGICLDVTARKAAEAQIRQAEDDRKIAAVVAAERQRFLDVLETLPAMICLLTPDHRVVFANRGFREVFGEGEGRPCYAYRFGLTAPCDFCKTFSVLSTGQPHHWELTTPGGRIIAAHDLPFTDVDGSPMVLEMDVDITEQRRAEKALADAHEALAERASQLRALAGDVTLTEQRERRRLARILHDHIQQLLVAAKLRVAIMGRMGDASMQAAAAEVEQLLGDSISSARALTSELSPPVLHESGLLAGLGWLARWMGDKHGLAVDLSVAADLPRLAEDASVLLFESVRELLFNVVKHASAAPATVTVRRTEDDDIRIVVSDRGPGFDRDFGIVPDDVAGGFGLFSIRERLGLLGGRLIIENVPGAGSQISLTAPLARVVEAPAPATMPESPTGSPDAEAQAGQPGTSRRIRVLIADDHALVREGVGKLIAQEPDMEVAGDAADGGEAVRLADSLRPDVILMDAQMPVLDGVEATAVIHRDRPEIRVIGLSMFEAAERAQAMREAGAVDYVTKSDPPGELVAAIRRAACRREPE